MNADEARILRARIDELEGRIARLPQPDAPKSWFQVGKVYNGGSMPASVPKVFLTHPADVFPAASEGGTATINVDTSRTVPMRVIGPGVPAVNDLLIGQDVPFAWEAMHPASSGGGTVVISGCLCSVPTTLYLTVAHGSFGIFYNATITYQPRPAWMIPLGYGPNVFLSTAQFLDTATGDYFWYSFECFFGSYILTRVYQTSSYGSPHRDSFRWTWAPGSPGNTCSPFALLGGTVYFGGDPTVNAQITP